MKTALIIIVATVLTACAHSGVVSTGPNSYMIANSEWGFSSGSVQKAKVIQEASEFCKNAGKQLLITNTTQNDVQLGKTPAAEVQFKCLKDGDPEFTH